MKPFLGAVAVAILMALIASMVIEQNYQTASYERFTTTGARITSPGDNLVRF